MPNPPQKATTSRNKSGQQAVTSTPNTRSAAANAASMSASTVSIENYMLPPKPIDEEAFKKADTDKKLDLMAAALNKMCESINSKMDTLQKDVDTKIGVLEKKLDGKIEPLWNEVFSEETGLVTRVNKLDQTVLDDTEGLKNKVQELEKAATDMNQNYVDLSKELESIKYQQDIIKGYTCKQADEISDLQEKAIEAIAKSMEKNITISGLREEQDEIPIEVAKKFLETELRIINLESNELFKIKDAFRVGQKDPAKQRLLVLKSNLFLKRKILEAYKEYKERLGGGKPQFFVNAQMPDKMVEQNRLVRHLIWDQRKKEEDLPLEQKGRITVQNNTVLVNKKVIKTRLPAVKPRHMFQDPENQNKLDNIKLVSSEIKAERGSYFRAFAARCTKAEDAHLVQVKVRQNIPEATHIVTAFNPDQERHPRQNFAFQDDNEHGAGLRMVCFLQENNYQDVALCIVRIYGGIHLGPRRFDIMKEHAKIALDKL